jgi:hypothetical protein
MNIIICIEGGVLVGVYTDGKRASIKAICVDLDNLKVGNSPVTIMPSEPLYMAPTEVRAALRGERI